MHPRYLSFPDHGGYQTSDKRQSATRRRWRALRARNHGIPESFGMKICPLLSLRWQRKSLIMPKLQEKVTKIRRSVRTCMYHCTVLYVLVLSYRLAATKHGQCYIFRSIRTYVRVCGGMVIGQSYVISAARRWHRVVRLVSVVVAGVFLKQIPYDLLSAGSKKLAKILDCTWYVSYILNHSGDRSTVDHREYIVFLNMWLEKFILWTNL